MYVVCGGGGGENDKLLLYLSPSPSNLSLIPGIFCKLIFQHAELVAKNVSHHCP